LHFEKLVSPIPYWSGYYRRRWQRSAQQAPRTLVIAYHRLGSSTGPSGVPLFGAEKGLSLAAFEAHLHFLRRHFHPVSVGRLLGDPDGLPPLSFAVTFDDGYLESLTVAAPILLHHGVPATFFVSTDFVGTDRRFWWEQLADCLAATKETQLAVDEVAPELCLRAGVPTRLRLGSHPERERAHDILSSALPKLAPRELDATLDRLAAGLGQPRRSEGRTSPLLGWEDVRALRDQGFEVGCHGASHDSLGRCPESQLESEVGGAVRRLEERLGEPVGSFAYPYGGPEHRSPAAIKAVRTSGCRGAFTAEPGVVKPDSDRYQLPRFHLNKPWAFACAYNVNRALNANPVDRMR
jgi:peptidoglycan/xylan/chitin deacetylase (PgdA/CDA1 family)